MKFELTREGALKKLDDFIENEIGNYSSKRNFDFGPNERKNISCLSPYITHRLITEYEVIKKVLRKRPYQKVEKFIQEIFWRVYWKGWLELRPKVWADFLQDLNNIENNKKIEQAKNGKTDISCFNDWVKELKEFNYLHNHTRMWFASIWIFTLKLPWQKGAEFFLEHLYDGDAASNTLSWRWVAGLQTKGKNYIAQSWNIEKFTNKKYQNIILDENPISIKDEREYKSIKIENNTNDKINDNLIFFENDLNLENINFDNYKNIYCLLLDNNTRKIKLSLKLLDFKMEIIKNYLKSTSKEIKFLQDQDNLNLFDQTKEFDVIYPAIGENTSFLENQMKKKDLKFRFIKNDKDIFCWKFSNKGYFNFKSNIPKIISQFSLT